MQEDEKDQVYTLMCKSFAPTFRLFFSWTPDVLIAKNENQILGAVFLKLFDLPRQRKGGLFSLLFSAPEARGLGVGQQLAEAGIAFFKQQNCDEIFANVEGYNPSSAKLFATRGFGIVSPSEQFRRYGADIFKVWWKTFHFIDIGHFMWVHPAPKQADNPALQYWGTIVLSSLIGLLLLWRQAISGTVIQPTTWFVLPLAIGGLFGLRYLGMWLAAKAQGLQTRFRAWESGFPLSIVFALLGGVYPSPGNIYPTENNWRYRDLLSQLGPIALAGTLPVLLVVWGVWGILQTDIVPYQVGVGLNAILYVGKQLALFDIALPIFPFTGFNGRRLWDWHKAVWVLLAIATAVIVFI